MDSAAVPGAGAIGAPNPSESTARSKRPEGVPEVRSVPPAASVDAIGNDPPPEVLEQMAQARRAYDELAAQGQSLHFGHDSSGRVTVELHGSDGQSIRSLSLAETLELTTGQAPE